MNYAPKVTREDNRTMLPSSSSSFGRGRHRPPGHFSPHPVVLHLIVILYAISTGWIVRFRPPDQKTKAIPPPLPPTNIANFPSLMPSHCAFPRPSEPTTRRTLIDCHVFEARDRAEQSNSSSWLQFNDSLKSPRRP